MEQPEETLQNLADLSLDNKEASPVSDAVVGSEHTEAGGDSEKDVVPAKAGGPLMDPALKQALIDSNRATVLKLEETVLQFVADAAQSTLEFPPSTSNYERLLQHKVAQHHLLQTGTALVSGTPRVTAKKPQQASEQVQKLSEIDVATIKIEPKMLIRRPPSANSMRNPDGSNGQQQNQQNQQRKKTHKEREADYHEARERLLGKSLPHGSGSSSTGNLAAYGQQQQQQAGSRPGSAGPSSAATAASPARPPATAGAGYLAAVPPTVGERGFNIVNPGRGAGRGGPNPGRGSGGRGDGSSSGNAVNGSADAAAAADGDDGQQQEQQQAADAAAGQQEQQQQQQRHGSGGRGPKAVYRDRQRDEQDPDYMRGVDRFQSRFDPGYGASSQQGRMYNMPTYGSEFPSLGNSSNSQQGGSHKQRHGAANGAAGPHVSRTGGSSRHSPGHARSGSGGASTATQNGLATLAADGAIKQGAGFSNKGDSSGSGNNKMPLPPSAGGQQQQRQQQQQGNKHEQQERQQRAQQRVQQYQAAQAQQQQQQQAAAMYYPGGPADPAAAAAMYQMAAAGQWGYPGMGAPMDPSMAAAYQYAAGYGGWGMQYPGMHPQYAGYGQPAVQQYGQQQQQYGGNYGGGHSRGGGQSGAGGGKGHGNNKAAANGSRQ